MSKRVGKWARIFDEGYNLTTRLISFTAGQTYNPVEVGGYTENMQYLNGRGDSTISMGGLFDPDTNQSHPALNGLSDGGLRLVTAAVGNNALPTVGDMSYSMQSLQTTYQVNPDLNGAVALQAEFASRWTSNMEYGVLLADTTVTANGNEASYDSGAQTTNGGVGYLHITALSAGDTITVTIEDSPNDSVWSTLLTFTLDGTAIDAERVAVAGTVERYIRAEYTVTGASISFPIAVAFIRS